MEKAKPRLMTSCGIIILFFSLTNLFVFDKSLSTNGIAAAKTRYLPTKGGGAGTNNEDAVQHHGNQTNNVAVVKCAEMTKQDTPPDTSVIILSSLIPTHPSISMINQTFVSIREMLDGLQHNTPIFISVDGLPQPKNTPENINTLHRYVKLLRLRFRHDPYVTILNNYEHGHINHSIKTALEMVETKFIHVVQHDFKFIKHINHTALVNVMNEFPNKVKIIRFDQYLRRRLKARELCNEYKEVESHGLHLLLDKWTDNNHFTTKAYYERLLDDIGPVKRPPEGPMMQSMERFTNASDCTYYYQYTYEPKDRPHIYHLDGKRTSPTKKDDMI